MSKLDEYRKKIDLIDQKLINYLEERLEIVDEVIAYKKENDLAIEDKQRENIIFDKLIANFKNIDNKEDLMEIFRALLETSKRRQKEKLSKTEFINRKFDGVFYKDAVFSVAKKASDDQSPDKVNATLGSLIGEDGELVTFKSVFDVYSSLDYKDYASYARGMHGNKEFLDEAAKWVLPSNYQGYHREFASPGGTGALTLVLESCLNLGESIVVSDLAWGVYGTMAKNRCLKLKEYEMFNDDCFNIEAIKTAISEVAKYQKRVVILINDPVHNPSGYTISKSDWKEILTFVGSLDNEVIILNDIAYIDFSYDLHSSRDYMHLFENLSANTLVVLAASASKSFTMYGVRIGVNVILGRESSVDTLFNTFLASGRGIWSSINNGAMVTLAKVLKEKKTEWLAEKQNYIDLLQRRSSIIINEANECGLKIYPYVDGFFITMKVADGCLNELHEMLIKQHVYTVKLKRDLRIAICGLPTKNCFGLAQKIKETYDNIKNKRSG